MAIGHRRPAGRRCPIAIKVIDITGGTEVTISGSIGVPSGSTVTTGGAATAAFSVGFEKLDYSVIYGLFDLDFTFSPASADISGLRDIFEGGAVLSFRDPHIIVESESYMGIPLVVSLDISADSDGDTVEVEDILLPGAAILGIPASEKFWIGENRSSAGGYVFAEAAGLNSIIKSSKEYLYLSGRAEPQAGVNTMFFPKEGQATLGYTLEIPLAPAVDFYAVSDQVIENAFDGDIVDYLFTGGTATIYGTATNGIPLGFELTLIITDGEGNPVGITFPWQEIAGPLSQTQPSVTDISFDIGADDMDKMKDARDIILCFAA
ncbi:MAG: DUF4621 domain-containing protein, partial [Alistipes sp.]|nr:DUF4621 domain-containing protein [Alistipes sp.]